jgi:ABC-type Fe3+/spermidine/putrescine transport system ATPase subunit
MKNLIYILLIFVLFSCENAGTLKQVDQGNNEQIEVYKYYYSDGNYVFVARFKDQQNIVSTTWKEQEGKVTKGNVVIFENDSIQVILKK